MAQFFSWARLSGSAPATGLGLDIGNTALRLVVLSRRRGRVLQLDRCASLPLPEGAVIDGRIQDPAQLGLRIAELLQIANCDLTHVALALPVQAVMCRHVSPAPDAWATPSALHAAMLAEAGRYLDVAAGDVCVDYHEDHDNTQRVDSNNDDNDDLHAGTSQPYAQGMLLAAARREQVDERLAAVAAAGLKATVLDIDLYAAYAATALQDVPACSALLMAGPSHSRLALFDRGKMLFHRELPGSDDLAPTDASTTPATTLPLAVKRALPPTGSQATHLHLGGTAATQAGLAERIARQSGISCAVADPFAGMASGPAVAPCPPAERAACLVACGLALRMVSP